jgi:ATP-dependent exoDNAse (exonuclease V) beta subunit
MTVSYSALAAYRACGYRYYLERVLGLAPVEEAPGGAPARLDARTRGVLAHLALEAIDFDRLRAPDAAALGALAAGQGIAAPPAELQALAGAITALLDAPLAGRLAACARVRREHPFAFALAPGEPLVVGVLDLLAHELDGGCLVVDYKTDRLAPGEDLAALVERDYGLQRCVYALAALRAGAARVEVAHWYLARPGEPVVASFEPADVATLETHLRAATAGLRAGEYGVAEAPHRGLCRGCPGRGGLCSWAYEATTGPAESPVPRCSTAPR